MLLRSKEIWSSENLKAQQASGGGDFASGDGRSALDKQSLNRNVTEEIIAISNDNTQF